ncbi:unnamed protein product, partial [Staurois parvus]
MSCQSAPAFLSSTVAKWLALLPGSTRVTGSNPIHGTTCLEFA